MTKFEKTMCEFISRKLHFFAIALFFIMGVIIRLNFRWFVSLDMSSYFLPWFHGYKDGGGLAALSHQVSNCDYTVFHQVFYAIISYLDIEPLFLIKGYSFAFDLLLSILTAFIVYELTKSSWKSIAGFAIAWISPIVFLNSACFGQNDSIYVCALLAAVLFYIKDKSNWFMIMYAIAISIKLQAILFLPVVLFLYFVHRRFSILQFLWVPFIYFISSLPAIIAGRPIIEVMNIYFLQTQEFDSVFWNYPSFWSLFLTDEGASAYNEFWHGAAMFFAFAITLGWMIWLFLKSKKAESIKFVISSSFILLYSVVFFLCGMHERYGYFVEILAIVLVLVYKETLVPMILLYISTLCAYSVFLFRTEISMVIPACCNLASYVIYSIFIAKDNLKNEEVEN